MVSNPASKTAKRCELAQLALRTKSAIGNRQSAIGNVSGFTMIEIALCLAIIGFALVSILLVLPSGMNTQRDTRQETIIGQDASVLMEAIRGGAHGVDDLTNYVVAITNYYTDYDRVGKVIDTGWYGYTYYAASYWRNNALVSTLPAMPLTNGLRIIGILSTPEFLNGTTPSGTNPISSTFGTFYTSNHIVAYIRSFSGLAAEKPPQDNSIMQGDTFSYRVLCVNAPMAVDTNVMFNSGYSTYVHQLAGNLRELRLLFEWPELPNGNVGAWRQTFRATVAGQLIPMDYSIPFGSPPQTVYPLYFYQSQSFATNVP